MQFVAMDVCNCTAHCKTHSVTHPFTILSGLLGNVLITYAKRKCQCIELANDPGVNSPIAIDIKLPT